MANDPDDFEQIVAGLNFEAGAGELLDSNAERIAAEQAAADPGLPAGPVDDDLGDESDASYRQVAPVELPEQRRLAAWAALAGGPVFLLVAALLSLTLPAILTAAAVLCSAGALVYLILSRPDQPDSGVDRNNDGAAS